MKKLKLLFPLIGATTAMASLIPAVSCGSNEHGEFTTYKVSLAESIKSKMDINISSIDEGSDLFGIIKLHDDTKIIDGKPTITINGNVLAQDKFTFTFINFGESLVNAYRLKISAEYINGDISIDVPSNIYKDVAKVRIENSLGATAENSISCSTPYFKDVPGETEKVTLELSATNGANVYVEGLVMDLFDGSPAVELTKVDSVGQLTQPNQWAFTNPEITSGNKVSITISAKTITQLNSYLHVSAFAVRPEDQAVTSEYTLLVEDGASEESIESIYDEDGAVRYDWDTKTIDYLWDGTITFNIYDPEYKEYRFDGISSISCGYEPIFDYSCEISTNGESMTIRFGAEAIAWIALQSEQEGDLSAVQIIPKLCYGTDLQLDATTIEHEQFITFDDDSSLIDPAHKGFISQKQVWTKGSDANLIVKLTDEGAENYTISEVHVNLDGSERSQNEGVVCEIQPQSTSAIIHLIVNQTTWLNLVHDHDHTLTIWVTLAEK